MRKKYMDRGQLLNILLALTKHECQQAEVIGFVHNQQTAVVEHKNKSYFIWDNGGEMGVEEINNEPGVCVPMTCFGSPLNALTVAYRISQVLQDKEIDYDFAYSNEESTAFLKTIGRNEEMYEQVSEQFEDDADEEI